MLNEGVLALLTVSIILSWLLLCASVSYIVIRIEKMAAKRNNSCELKCDLWIYSLESTGSKDERLISPFNCPAID